MSVIHMLTIYGTILILLQNVHTSPIVQINNSQIIGQQISFSEKKVNQYLGIPYAKPPVGQLRFQKPQPVQNYPPAFQAITNPPACPQYTTQPYPWYINSTDKSEDCLYLNIWTPSSASPTNKKAVFFWIHGGGFRYGSIRSKLYSGIPLSSVGDIIVVTVNYRLGPLGFLATGTNDAPPNIGLWDVLEGLKWVNRNIRAFGGDSTRITIAGESAGSVAVGLLTTSPLTKGLYTRLIMESTAPFSHIFDSNAGNIVLTQQLAEKVGCASATRPIALFPVEVVQCMRGVDADTLTRADFELVPYSSASFFPQWGDDLLPENPRNAIQEGNFRCKDLLIGNNKDEGSLLITTSDPTLYGFFGKKKYSHINKTLGQDMIQKAVGSLPVPQSTLASFLPSSLTDRAHKVIRHQVSNAIGDVLLVCPDVYYAEKCAEQDQNVYFYFFTHRPSVTPWAKWMGVAHYEEIQFVFGQPIFKRKKYHSSEESLSRQMVGIWSHFVKYGKPDIQWPLYSRGTPLFKYLGPKNVTGKNGIGPRLTSCNLLRPLL